VTALAVQIATNVATKTEIRTLLRHSASTCPKRLWPSSPGAENQPKHLDHSLVTPTTFILQTYHFCCSHHELHVDKDRETRDPFLVGKINSLADDKHVSLWYTPIQLCLSFYLSVQGYADPWTLLSFLPTHSVALLHPGE
jgi:hypothetical protein